MRPVLLWLTVCLVAGFGAVQCVFHESQPTPEQLIEQQPSGAGFSEELEQRPGYFKNRH